MTAPQRETLARPQVREVLVPLAPVLAMVAIMWVEEIVDTPLNGRLDRFGIRPRRLDGLDGIVFSPFLHSGFGHLIANTLPFLILGGALALGNAKRFLLVTLVVGLIGGFGTWLTGGSHQVVIGASGLVFGYLTCLLTRGVFARKASYLVGGLVVLVIYGGILWGVIPRPGVSWQGHVSGAIGGVVAAWLVYRRKPTGDEPAAPTAPTALGPLA